MKDDINLTLGKKTDKKRTGIFFGISAIIFVITFVISAALLLYSLSLGAKVAQLQQTENEKRSKITALSTQKARILSINERLSEIDKIINGRRSISERANAVLAIVPQGFSILNFSATEDAVALNLDSASLSDYDTLLEGRIPLFAKDNPLGLTKIDMTAFTERPEGYSAAINFQFAEDL